MAMKIRITELDFFTEACVHFDDAHGTKWAVIWNVEHLASPLQVWVSLLSFGLSALPRRGNEFIMSSIDWLAWVLMQFAL